MPFESPAPRRFMYSQHPKFSKEFENVTPKGMKLPEKTSGTLHEYLKKYSKI